MLGIAFFQNSVSKGAIPTTSDTAIKVATSGGTVIGQLGFGWLADVVGRKKMYGLELMIIIFATLAQALSSPSHAISIVGLFIFWRVLMVSKQLLSCIRITYSHEPGYRYWWRLSFVKCHHFRIRYY